MALSETAAIILAAGKSTRMKSDLPKVLHEVCGQPMLGYVIDVCRLAGAERVIVVVGYGKEQIRHRFEGQDDIQWVEQAEQKGTAHAVLCCRELLAGFSGNVLVIAGDMPLVKRVTLAGLVESRERSGDALALATTVLDEPSGYGRIVRDGEGRLEAIVEECDCTRGQRELREVNPSYYCFDAERLFEALAQVEPGAKKGEDYLTDAVRILSQAGHGVSASIQVPPEEAMGVNSRLDLAMVNRVMQDRIQARLMNEGVTIVDPDNTWIEADVSAGLETVVYPFSVIGTAATIGKGCRIGPFAHVGGGAVVEDGSVVGPIGSMSGVAAS